MLGVSCLLSACRNTTEGSMQPFNGYPMLSNREEIKQLLKDKCLDTIRFNKGEVIADIDAGNSYLEAMLSLSIYSCMRRWISLNFAKSQIKEL